MDNDQHKIIIVGVIVHCQPEKIPFLKAELENSPNVARLIRFQESDNKLWIVSREGDAL